MSFAKALQSSFFADRARAALSLETLRDAEGCAALHVDT
jgi:hypothetical protein